MHNLIFGPALFYDIPEYSQIVSSHSFLQSLTLGHFPIHPVFMAILWPLVKLIPVNLIAILFTLASIFILFKISRKASLIYILLPAIWIIGSNLMIESILLFFYILSLYFLVKDKKYYFFMSIFLMMGVHIEAVFWIPTLFLIPGLLEIKIDVKKFISYAVLGVAVSLAFYLLLYKLSARDFSGSTEQAITYFSSGILRMIRNIWLTFSTSFGSLTIFVLIYLFVKKFKRKEKIAFVTLFIIFALVAANWQGDLMARRAVFFAIPLSIVISKYLGRWWWMFVIYLLPITLCNVFLYAKGSPFIKPNIPENQILIETHYLKPFTKYNGEILWMGESNMDKITNYLTEGKRVFMTKDVVMAPYRLLVGNNYHITSLRKVGDSESRFLFTKYKVVKFENVYELIKYDGVVSPFAGEPEIFYATDFASRLSRRRIDYGDIGVWIWSVVTGNKDPVGWTYKDVTGAWVYDEIGI